jgi:hypothetical protein
MKHRRESNSWLGNRKTSLHNHHEVQGHSAYNETSMRGKVKCLTEIKISIIIMSLRADKKGNEIRISYQTGDGRFSFNEIVLTRISFKRYERPNIVINSKLK